VANQRRRKTFIYSLEGPEGATSELPKMLDIATNFYKDMFNAEARTGFSLSDGFFSQEEKLSNAQNEIMVAPFTEEEVKKAVFDYYSDGALGPDGLSFIFYQKF
jgi:hypothetical protein